MMMMMMLMMMLRMTKNEDANSARGYKVVLQLFCRAFDENRDQTSDGTNEMKTQCVCEMLNFKTRVNILSMK